mmetsp:Transcript_94551/g.173180  ORF Transcript_94551/g.173180 Transcript_94551/m.173180 type:complete len:200 (+) Transcript_94551:70-669(+)
MAMLKRGMSALQGKLGDVLTGRNPEKKAEGEESDTQSRDDSRQRFLDDDEPGGLPLTFRANRNKDWSLEDGYQKPFWTLRFRRTPLGMTLENRMPLVVSRVQHKAEAARLGVQVGWELTKIGERRTDEMTWQEALRELQKASQQLLGDGIRIDQSILEKEAASERNLLLKKELEAPVPSEHAPVAEYELLLLKLGWRRI